MMLKSSKIFFSLFFVFLSFTQLNGEEKIDIWKNDKKQKTISEENKNTKLKIKDNQNLQETSKILSEEKISIEEGSSITSNEVKVYGVYDPQDFNFNLLQYPYWQRIDLLPKEFKLKVKEKMEKHLKWLKPLDHLTRATKGFESGIDYMMRRDLSSDINQFKKGMQKLDDIRDENLIKVFPELQELYG